MLPPPRVLMKEASLDQQATPPLNGPPGEDRHSTAPQGMDSAENRPTSTLRARGVRFGSPRGPGRPTNGPRLTQVLKTLQSSSQPFPATRVANHPPATRRSGARAIQSPEHPLRVIEHTLACADGGRGGHTTRLRIADFLDPQGLPATRAEALQPRGAPLRRRAGSWPARPCCGAAPGARQACRPPSPTRQRGAAPGDRRAARPWPRPPPMRTASPHPTCIRPA